MKFINVADQMRPILHLSDKEISEKVGCTVRTVQQRRWQMLRENGVYKAHPPERIELLKQLWDRGVSASGIAARLGCFGHCKDGGRSAVCGLVYRLGLPGRITIKRTTRPGPRKPRTAKPRAAFGFIPMPRNGPPVLRPAPQPDDIARVSFVDLADHECKFPVGDVVSPHEKQFCGLERSPGTPYCAHHFERCYGPTPSQRFEGKATGRIRLNTNGSLNFEMA